MRIVRVLTRPNVGGPTRQLVALWHAQRALGARTLILCGICEADEVALDLEAAGVPRLSREAVFDGGADSEGFHVVDSLRRGIAPLADLRAQRAIAAILPRARPDVVHTHTSKAGVLGRLAAAAVPAALRAHTFHGLVLADYAGVVVSRAARRIETWLARRTDRLFAVSASCAAELRAFGVTRRAIVVPPAVSTARFARREQMAARRALGAADGRPAFGFVGRLVAIKRPECFAGLAAAMPDVDAFVIGTGPRRAALAALRVPNLHFLDHREDPAELVAGLDLLVLPSRREGFPVAAVEAAAAGVRTLGFAVPGLVDLAAFPEVATLVPCAGGTAALIAAARTAIEAGLPRAGEGARDLVRDCQPTSVARRQLQAYGAREDDAP